MQQIDLEKFISLCDPEPPRRFYAVCAHCEKSVLFYHGRCSECNRIFTPLLELLKRQDPATA